MGKKVSFTALVTGIPPFIHGPQLRQGETIPQFLVRHYPDEWKNLIEHVRTNTDASAQICNLLQSLKLSEITNPVIISQIEDWSNDRLPTNSRTIKSLSELKQLLPKEDEFSSLKIIDSLQIVWPREKDPSGDTSVEREASALGAEIVALQAGFNREMDLGKLMSYVNGTFLWLVPGGSFVMASEVLMSLERIVSMFNKDHSAAAYSDGSYSIIYRVSAIKEVLKSNRRISSTHGEIAGMLKTAGYILRADNDAEMALCEVEEIYGGNYPFPSPTKTSWLQRILGR